MRRRAERNGNVHRVVVRLNVFLVIVVVVVVVVLLLVVIIRTTLAILTTLTIVDMILRSSRNKQRHSTANPFVSCVIIIIQNIIFIFVPTSFPIVMQRRVRESSLTFCILIIINIINIIIINIIIINIIVIVVVIIVVVTFFQAPERQQGH
jgi:hypothetical protein